MTETNSIPVQKRLEEHLNYRGKKRAKKRANGERLQCNFVMVQKAGRRCNMTRPASEQYCAQHILEVKDKIGGRKRIPCPLDPGHTIWEDQLESHRSKCRSNPELNVPTEGWFQLDYNIKRLIENGGSEQKEVNYEKWIKIVRKMYESIDEKVERVVLDHFGLEERLEELKDKKHALQQASIIGNMDNNGLLGAEGVVIEFGCGRGELSRYIARSQLLKQLRNQENSTEKSTHVIVQQKFLLVDRAGPRMKLDSKIEKDFVETLQGLSLSYDQEVLPKVERLKIDIKDLVLDKVPILDGTAKIVAVSKHLCGCATDLTLQCLRNSQFVRGGQLVGIEIALCCRQLCSYETFSTVGLKWLEQHGIDQEGFKVLTTMTSWAVCGSRGKQNEGKNLRESKHPSGLDEEDRQKVGLMARKIIDYGRVLFLREWDGLDVKLVEYIDSSVSLENVCLIASVKE